MHSVKLSVDERDSVRSVGAISESCAVLLLGIEFRVLIRAGWGEVCKSLVIVLLLTGEEKFERSRVALEKSVVLLGGSMCCVWSWIWSRCMEWTWWAADACVARKPTADAEY